MARSPRISEQQAREAGTVMNVRPPEDAKSGISSEPTFIFRGKTYAPGDERPDDFPAADDLAMWQNAPSPFDLDNLFPLPVPPVPEPAPFVSEAGQPVAADPEDGTWPALAAREAADAAAGVVAEPISNPLQIGVTAETWPEKAARATRESESREQQQVADTNDALNELAVEKAESVGRGEQGEPLPLVYDGDGEG